MTQGSDAPRASALAWLGLVAFAMLLGLTVMDWAAYHEIFHEYASPETLASAATCQECGATLPWWTRADGEWHAAYLGLIIRAGLGLLGIGTAFFVAGRGSWRRKALAALVTLVTFLGAAYILAAVWKAYMPAQ